MEVVLMTTFVVASDDKIDIMATLCFQLTTPLTCTALSGIILCMLPANERRRYSVTPSLIGWAHTHNAPCLWAAFTFMILLNKEVDKKSGYIDAPVERYDNWHESSTWGALEPDWEGSLYLISMRVCGSKTFSISFVGHNGNSLTDKRKCI